MRTFLASVIGAIGAAALAATPALPTTAGGLARPGRTGTPPISPATPAGTGSSAKLADPGSTRTIPLQPLAPSALPRRGQEATEAQLALAADAPPGRSTGLGQISGAQGLTAPKVRPFSLLGIVWDNAADELTGAVQVRTKSVADGTWSEWRDVQAHSEDGPEPDSAETAGRPGRHLHGGTAPLWVGPSNGVQVRVLPDKLPPAGLRLAMVDPGHRGSPITGQVADRSMPASDGPTDPNPGSFSVLTDIGPNGIGSPVPRYVGPRPAIVTRTGWQADEQLRDADIIYSKTLSAAFIHHTATGNEYSCAQVPDIIRSIYRYHVESETWRDVGYNFLVDKCGTIYEGRAGSLNQPVRGAHTRGFNIDTLGIAVIGTYSTTQPSAAALRGVASVAAWKLGLYGTDPTKRTQLVSTGGKFKKGQKLTVDTIAGHRDAFDTACPGAMLYQELGSIRTQAAQLQGRPHPSGG